MSKQAATEFLDKVANDEVLETQLKAQAGDRTQRLAAVVSAGRQHGFQFTEDEVIGVLRTKEGEGALDERQLAQVAGGGYVGKALLWLLDAVDCNDGDPPVGGCSAASGVRG